MPLSPVKRNAFDVVIEGLTDVNGYDNDQIISVQIPTVTFDTAEHVEANHKVETPTLIDVQEFEIMLLEENGANANTSFFATKSPMALDASGKPTGGLVAESSYKFSMQIVQLALDHSTVLRRFTMDGCWIKQRSYDQSERNSADNLVVTYTLQCTSITEAVT